MHITQPYTAVQSVSASASALFILASPFCALNAFREDVLYNIDLRKEHQRLSTPLSFRMKFSLTRLGTVYAVQLAVMDLLMENSGLVVIDRPTFF